MTIKVDEDGRYPVLRTKEDRRLPESRRFLVLRRDQFRCVFCGCSGPLEVDHIIPWSAGGSDDMDNLRTLCRGCNQDRSNFKVPADEARRLPNGHECVYCDPQLVGEPDLTPIYCVQCNKKAPGIPNDPSWHPDVGRDSTNWWDHDEPDELWAARHRAAVVAAIRASSPPMNPNDEGWW